VQAAFDGLVEANLRFLKPPPEEPAPAEPWQTYTIQPGDTLSVVARQMYGQASLWRIIFEANRDVLTDPGRVFPGQVLKIPPKPAA
jgi:nucleoid-associated protein YgaU